MTRLLIKWYDVDNKYCYYILFITNDSPLKCTVLKSCTLSISLLPSLYHVIYLNQPTFLKNIYILLIDFVNLKYVKLIDKER